MIKRRAKKPIFRLFSFLLLAMAAVVPSSLFMAPSVSAQSPSYSWEDSSTINIGPLPEEVRSIENRGGGGSINVNDPRADGTSTGGGSFTIRVASGFLGLQERECSIPISIIVDADNQSGVLSKTDQASDPNSNTTCPTWMEDSFFSNGNQNISISGQRFTEEEQEQQEQFRRAIVITVLTPLEAGEGPETITGRARIPAPRVCEHSTCNQTATLYKDERDGHTIYQGGVYVNPGTYEVSCVNSDSLPFGCGSKQITKQEGVTAFITLGDTPETAVIDVYLVIDFEVYENRTPQVVLYRGAEGEEQVATADSEEADRINDRVPDERIESQQWSQSYAQAFFRDVEPGSYRVCVLEEDGPKYCEYITKEAGEVREVTLLVGYDLRENADEPVCTAGAIGWFMCPFVIVITEVTGFLARIIEELLIIEPLTFNTDNPIFTVWSFVRNLANVGLILVFLLVIISQITSLGLSNYGIKRILPRLVIAAILLNVSYFVCALAVDVFNLLGAGVQGVFGAGIDATVVEADTGEVNELVGAGAGQWLTMVGSTMVVLLAAAYTGVLPLIMTPISIGAAAILAAFVVLVLRQVLVTLLIVVSPLAFLAWLAPGTSGLFTTWRRTLTTLLMTYPIVMALFYGSAFVASIINTAGIAENIEGGGEGEWLTAIAVFIILCLPIALLPTTMRLAGGLGKRFNGLTKAPSGGAFKWMRDQGAKWSANSAGARRREANKTARQVRSDRRWADRFQRGGLRGKAGRAWNIGAGAWSDEKISALNKKRAEEDKTPLPRVPGASTRDIAQKQLKAQSTRMINQEGIELKKALKEAISGAEINIRGEIGNEAEPLERKLRDALQDNDLPNIVAAANVLSANKHVEQLQDVLRDTLASGDKQKIDNLHEAFRENLPKLDPIAPELSEFAVTPRNRTYDESYDSLVQGAYSGLNPGDLEKIRPVSAEKGVEYIKTRVLEEGLSNPRIAPKMGSKTRPIFEAELQKRRR